MNRLIQQVEEDFKKDQEIKVEAGDFVKVNIKIKEGKKERIQPFNGIVIAIKGKGINRRITVRKLSFGIGVEKTFPIHSPSLHQVIVEKQSKVRRAKLFYLREKVGKAAERLKPRITKK